MLQSGESWRLATLRRTTSCSPELVQLTQPCQHQESTSPRVSCYCSHSRFPSRKQGALAAHSPSLFLFLILHYSPDPVQPCFHSLNAH